MELIYFQSMFPEIIYCVNILLDDKLLTTQNVIKVNQRTKD